MLSTVLSTFVFFVVCSFFGCGRPSGITDLPTACAFPEAVSLDEVVILVLIITDQFFRPTHVSLRR